MVHQTIAISTTKASKASSKIRPMSLSLSTPSVFKRSAFATRWWGVSAALLLAILGSLPGCSSTPPLDEPSSAGTSAGTPPADTRALPPPITQSKSRWVAVPWSDLPGLEQDALHEAWPAWLRSCERNQPVWARLCPEVRELAKAAPEAQRDWMRQRLQAYRVESHEAQTSGLLTAYYEPLLDASRLPKGDFRVPLYAAPSDLGKRKPWYTRQEMETLSAAKAALRGKELVYLNDPVDAMVLHIQGSGIVRVSEPDGRQRLVRMAYAGTNDQPYKSIGRWLLDQGLVRDASWPGIKAWIARNPARVQELLWSNPRVVFFKEEALPPGSTPPGPKGAQGVPLTAGRSIAVDRESIPYGTPVWLSSRGPQTSLNRLVLAQDTGTAIVGAVRADYYAGSGPEAGELAGRLKQPLQLWVLWPR
ncbi:MltA domain-containing protein [Limnohabitans sp. JUR4]|uniref:peptidoglycan lytic exotransglycosylase n=2 Tax=Limnohabitans radicicola TaxID=2771427 RepID=A0A927FFN4_9BURK|nr:MltA domain-containing protein [Limnohabitans radicicola]